jgi:hypothetical protein
VRQWVCLTLLALRASGTATGREEQTSEPAPTPAAARAPAPGVAPSSGSGSEDFANVSLDDLLNVDTAVATKSAVLSQQDTPGIVTVVTREEILRGGARDMIDVLQLVAGFAFGADQINLTSLGIRGLWGAEGKVLVLLDGHEMHELSFLSTYFGNRFSVDWIDRVEIIRGPGSVMYGGAAELVVINIITRNAVSINGASIAGMYGEMLDGAIHHGLSLDNLAVKVDLFAGQGKESDRRFVDLNGASVNLSDCPKFADGHTRCNSQQNPLDLNLAVEWRGLKFSYLFEDVIELKDGRLRDEKPRCLLDRIGLDLSDQEVRRNVLEKVTAASRNVLVLSEAVIPYLTEDAVASLAAG